jgi:hypothetical protein
MATYESLPTELKMNVFAYVLRPTDQANICLVSREFRSMMGPLLWEKLTLNVRMATFDRVLTLLHPSNGVLRNVRHLYVSDTLEMTVGKCSSSLETILQLFIGALPREVLRSFVSGLVISGPVILQLLMCQRTITTLDSPYESDTYSAPGGTSTFLNAPWIPSLLASVTNLCIYVESAKPKTYEISGTLLKSVPGLKELTIAGDSLFSTLDCDSGQLDAFGGTNTDADPSPLLLLSYLRMLSMDLAQDSVIYRYVDIASLRHLHLNKCINIASFLTALATRLPKTHNLVRLVVIVAEEVTDPDGDIQAIETLLASVTGFQDLSFDVAGGRMVDTSAICRHGSTLHHLGLYSSIDDGKYVSPAQLATTLNGCPELIGLAINFCGVDMGTVQTLGSGFRLQKIEGTRRVPTELESFLVRLDRVLPFQVLTMTPRAPSLSTKSCALCVCAPYHTSIMIMIRTLLPQMTRVSWTMKSIQLKLPCTNLHQTSYSICAHKARNSRPSASPRETFSTRFVL